MIIRLKTLGGLRVYADDRELDGLPAQNARAALLVYLAVIPTLAAQQKRETLSGCSSSCGLVQGIPNLR